MSLLKVPMPTNGILTTEYVDMLITTVNALVSTRDWQDGVNNNIQEAIKILLDRVQALEAQVQANQSSLDMERSHFILQLHAQKIIDRDEARQMLGLPPGERRNPAPFTKDDLDSLTNERVKDNADCIMDCLEQAIEDGELPVDIGAIE